MLKNTKSLLAANIALLLAIAYTIAITVLSLIQLGDLSIGDFSPTDKLLHAGASFILAILWMLYYLLKTERDRNYMWVFVKISLIVIAFGIFIEVLQGTLTGYRQPDTEDVLANCLGVLLALLLFIVFQDHLKRLKHKINLFF